VSAQNTTPDDVPAEIFSIRWETIRNILWLREEFDGIGFDHDEEGATVVYAYDPWGLNLFLLQFAAVMGGILHEDPPTFERTYDTLAQLTMGMSLPSLAPERGDDVFSVKLPCIRITGQPKDN
jgi:hypothetical protein